MARIFISHSSVDKPFVTRLAEDLRNHGARVWLDDWELRAGDDLTNEIERGISIHDYFVIVISRSALASKWVNQELKWALDREKSNKATLVLPVIIDNTALPDSISGKKCVDFTADYATQLNELLKVIRFATVKDYPILDRRLTTARRGVPTVEGDLHRIGMYMAGNKACIFFAIVESVGDEQLAPDLTTAIGSTLRMMAENQLKDGTVLTPKDTRDYINLANSVAKYYKVNAKLPLTHSLGAKMAVGIQMYDRVVVATVGGTSAMVQTHAEDGGSTIMRFTSDQIFHVETDNQRVSFDSPLGFASIGNTTVLQYKEFPFTQPTDRIALLSYEVPEDIFQKNLGEAIAKTTDPEDVAILLAEFREPAVEDTVCMLLTLDTNHTEYLTGGRLSQKKAHAVAERKADGEPKKNADAEVAPLEEKCRWVEKERKQEEEQKLEAIQKTFTNSIGMEFVLIPAGSFAMGSSAGETLEKPSHEVKVSQSFYLQTTQVTQGQWKEVKGDNPSHFIECGDNCPVEKVSWNDAQEFIQKLNDMEGIDIYHLPTYRLPTEAEWEYACRAGTTTEFSFGDEKDKLTDYAWFDSNSDLKTHRVGTKEPNPWGLYDMHGNIWEWVEDDWHDTYYGAPVDGSAWIDKPRFPLRVIRGGGWRDDAGLQRSAIRRVQPPDRCFGDGGFRLGRSVSFSLEEERKGKEEEQRKAGEAEAKRKEEALQAYNQDLELNPELAGAWFNKGNALGKLGRIEEALQAFEKALKLYPEYADAWHNKGAALGQLGRIEEALQAYNKALELNPELASAWFNKGVSLGDLGLNEEALQAFNKALELNPEHADAWYNKGVSLNYLGRSEEAQIAIRKAEELIRKHK